MPASYEVMSEAAWATCGLRVTQYLPDHYEGPAHDWLSLLKDLFHGPPQTFQRARNMMYIL